MLKSKFWIILKIYKQKVLGNQFNRPLPENTSQWMIKNKSPINVIYIYIIDIFIFILQRSVFSAK